MDDGDRAGELPRELLLAHEHRRHGRLAEAERAYREVLLKHPHRPAALHGLGLVLHLRRESAAAVEFLRGAVAEAPDCVEFRSNLAVVLGSLGRHEESAREVVIALRYRPDYADGWRNLGAALEAQGKLEEAVEAYGKAAHCLPLSADPFRLMGNALRRLGKHEPAESAYRQALKLNPLSAREHYNLAQGLESLSRFSDAEEEYERAASLAPTLGKCKAELGRLRARVGKFDEATEALEQALRLDPQCQTARRLSVHSYTELGEVDSAIAHLRAMVAQAPESAELQSSLLYTLHYDEKSTPGLLFEEHREWGRRHAEPLRSERPAHKNDRRTGRRLRIGYVSPDFRDHTVTRFISGAIEHHDREAFEVVCYSDSEVCDSTTARLRGWAEGWREISGLTDRQADGLIRQDLIDILVDLRGHGINNRLTLFARKPAPVQAVMVGYFDTTGLSTMDYRITDGRQDPPGLTDGYHTERLIRLPDSCWCYSPDETSPEVAAPPVLSRGYITFGSLNKLAKISAGCAKAWATLLHSVPGSRLLLVVPGAGTHEHVRKRLEQFGIPATRLLLVGKTPNRADYLRRFYEIDICLDPFPFNGITTSCDGLWMGVPFITLYGNTSVSRAGGSILRAAGLDELVAGSEQEYIELASTLAGDPDRLRLLRLGMRDRLRASPLTGHREFAAALDAAFRRMWESFCAGSR
jgi:predicted O-linked N-acetylglucosamine transferase (SPINDLY family)